jgi:hypothetical protein
MVEGLGFRNGIRVSEFRFGVWGIGIKVQRVDFRVQGLRFEV